MATTTKKKPAVGTKKAVIFSILDQKPNITTEAALKELKRRKVDMGDKAKQNFYSVKTLWNQDRSKTMRRTGPGSRKAAKPAKRKYKRRVVEQSPSGTEMEVELQLLQAENARLKAAIAVLLS